MEAVGIVEANGDFIAVNIQKISCFHADNRMRREFCSVGFIILSPLARALSHPCSACHLRFCWPALSLQTLRHPLRKACCCPCSSSFWRRLQCCFERRSLFRLRGRRQTLKFRIEVNTGQTKKHGERLNDDLQTCLCLFRMKSEMVAES